MTTAITPATTTINCCTYSRWFLDALLERPRPDGLVYWLRQITLECADNMARHTATRLIAHACCCGANDPEEWALLIAVDRASGRALHRYARIAVVFCL